MSGQTTRSKQGRASSRKHDVDPGRSPRQKVERLEAEVERLRRELNDAKKQIADLERQLALRQQNSTASSKPPSSDGLAGSPAGTGPPQEKPPQARWSSWTSWTLPLVGAT